METQDNCEPDRQVWKDRHFALLCAVVDACRAKGIRVFLYGETALSALRDGELSDFPTICIDVRDARRFAEAVEPLEAQAGFVLDSMLRSPFFPDFEFRVIDANSIDFDAERMYRYCCNGLAIRVLFILHVPDDAQDAGKAAELLKAYRHRARALYGKGKARPPLAAVKLAGRAASLVPHGVSRAAFRRLSAAYSGESDVVTVGGKRFSPSVFEEEKPVEVRGRDFAIPADADGFFTALFGEGWRDRKIACFKEKRSRFRDARHSWAELAEGLDAIDFREVKDRMAQYRKLTKQFKAHHAPIVRSYDYLDRTHQHFLMKVEYDRRAPELRKLLDAGELAQLEGDLASYLAALETCRAKGLGLCFDDEVFAIALELLRRTGRAEYADELEALVRAEAEAKGKHPALQGALDREEVAL